MGRNTTKRIALTPETKALVDEQKPNGVEYDYYIRHAVLTCEPLPADA